MKNTKKALYNVHTLGDKNAPKILLVHGAGFYWENCFEPFIKEFKDKYCLIIPELAGHGKDDQGYMKSISDTAQLISNELLEVDINHIDVAYGISLGASIVCEIGLQKKIKIDKMILDSGQYVSMGEMTEQYSNFMADAFIALEQGNHFGSPVKESMGYENNEDVRALKPLLGEDISRETLVNTFRVVYDYDVRQATEKLDSSVIIMYGTNEIYAPQSTPIITSICINSPIEVRIADCGHAQALSEKPEEIINVVKNCL